MPNAKCQRFTSTLPHTVYTRTVLFLVFSDQSIYSLRQTINEEEMTGNPRTLVWLIVCLCLSALPVWASEDLEPKEMSEGLNTEEYHGEEEQEDEHYEEEEGSSDEDEDESSDEEQLYFYAGLQYVPIKESVLLSEEDVWAHHEFLLKPDPEVHRIVEFYAHWCPHCQHMRGQVAEFSKRIKDISEHYNLQVEVHAVSCVPFRAVCQHFDVHAYPRIYLFRAGETEPILIEHNQLHPYAVLRKIGLELDMDEEEEPTDSIGVPIVEPAPGNGVDQDHFLPRRKKDIYNDAYLSFHFAMKNGIFTDQGPLTNSTREHFTEFLDLVQATMPPSFHLNTLVAEILSNADEALASEEALVALVDKFPPKKKSWSHSCTRGDPAMGYTCGLWELFHLMTVGVVEYNNMITAADDFPFYRPMDSAVVLKDFVENFFGCEVCRVHFLQGFNGCAYDGCNRLIDHVGTIEDWMQLPMWLYEFHNGVNIRLMKEKAEREGRIPTPEDEIAVQWPSRKDCPMCWHDDGKFDPTNVFIFLRLTYWPDDIFSDNMRKDLQSSELNLRRQREFRNRDAMMMGILLLAITIPAVFLYEKRRRRISMAQYKKDP